MHTAVCLLLVTDNCNALSSVSCLLCLLHLCSSLTKKTTRLSEAPKKSSSQQRLDVCTHGVRCGEKQQQVSWDRASFDWMDTRSEGLHLTQRKLNSIKEKLHLGKNWNIATYIGAQTAGGRERKMLAQPFGTTYPRITPYHHPSLWYATTPTPFRCEGGAILA